MSVENLVQHFGAVEDPRCCGKVLHRLQEILVIAVCAVIACAESWDDIALYGRSWLKTFLELPNGIPSHDTFRRVFMLIDPDAFEGCFARWAQSLMGKVEREVVAIDGKSNEITAIPELLDTLHLDGCIVTLDAMGCQKDIAARIRAKGADVSAGAKIPH